MEKAPMLAKHRKPLLGPPGVPPPCGQNPLNNGTHVEKTGENLPPMWVLDTPHVGGSSEDAKQHGGIQTQHGGGGETPKPPHGGSENANVKHMGGVDQAPNDHMGVPLLAPKPNMGTSQRHDWLETLRGYYDSLIKRTSAARGTLGTLDWCEIYRLHLVAIDRETPGLDSENSDAIARYRRTFQEALGYTLRRHMEDLIRRHYRGELIGDVEGFQAGEVPAEKRELFDRWWATLQAVTREIGQVADEIATIFPGYTTAQDEPGADWLCQLEYKGHRLPEALCERP